MDTKIYSFCSYRRKQDDFLSNVLDFYVTEEVFDKYIKVIPYNNIFNFSDSIDILITKSCLKISYVIFVSYDSKDISHVNSLSNINKQTQS